MTIPRIVKQARLFAMDKHGDQQYGKLPYCVHLYEVVLVAYRFGFDWPEIISACWLHDTIEDTNVSYHDLVYYFGRVIADTVAAVSKTGVGSRKQQNMECYERTAMNLDAIIVKMCDRIANVESGEKNDMYRKENAEFLHTLSKHPKWWMVATLETHLIKLLND